MTHVAHVGRPPHAFYVFVSHLDGNSTAIARHNPPLWIGTFIQTRWNTGVVEGPVGQGSNGERSEPFTIGPVTPPGSGCKLLIPFARTRGGAAEPSRGQGDVG